MTEQTRLARAGLIDIIMRETTDQIVADGWDKLGNPNILVQGCKFVRRAFKVNSEDGYADPDDAAKKFAGFIADAVLAETAPLEATIANLRQQITDLQRTVVDAIAQRDAALARCSSAETGGQEG